ncbi:hypothetical protein ACTXT7_015163 [Hymenolepis weldensis]
MSTREYFLLMPIIKTGNQFIHKTFLRWTSVISRRRSLGVLIDTRLGIYVQIDKHTAGPPVNTVVEILSPGDDRHLLGINIKKKHISKKVVAVY